jgi:hypothetical protein
MKLGRVEITLVFTFALCLPVQAQSELEAPLCEAAKTNRVVQMIYDKDISKGCLPRLVDVHQIAIGNNDKMYMHGWQIRGCTKVIPPFVGLFETRTTRPFYTGSVS